MARPPTLAAVALAAALAGACASAGPATSPEAPAPPPEASPRAAEVTRVGILTVVDEPSGDEADEPAEYRLLHPDEDGLWLEPGPWTERAGALHGRAVRITGAPRGAFAFAPTAITALPEALTDVLEGRLAPPPITVDGPSAGWSVAGRHFLRSGPVGDATLAPLVGADVVVHVEALVVARGDSPRDPRFEAVWVATRIARR